jgi:hypothetical protein
VKRNYYLLGFISITQQQWEKCKTSLLWYSLSMIYVWSLAFLPADSRILI